MKAFLCVYRHPIISLRDRQIVQENAANNPVLQSFLDDYFDPSSCYDWGDNPSFFQATKLLGDPRLASWGVCRPPVRPLLRRDDLVIFICGREGPDRGSWDYCYVGYGTVQVSLQREEIWQNDQYAAYRPFFNIISRWENDQLIQYEVFERDHDTFENRCQAGYILFKPEETDFNLVNPLPIARYDRGETAERWYTNDPLVDRLQTALFLNGTIDRQLNSGTIGYSHVQIPIHTHLKRKARLAELPGLRPKLARISAAVRSRSN